MPDRSEERTVAVGLLGRGIARSASPEIHEAEAAAHGVALTYRLVDFDALGLNDDALGATLNLLSGMGFVGVNITFPFKQAVIPLLDEVSDVVAALGAVNCVQFKDGRKIGCNSDWIGFSWLVESELAGVSLDCVVQLGAGGAGSATAYALLRAGVRTLRLCDPAPGKAHDLANRMGQLFPAAEITAHTAPGTAIEGCDGIVQTTPVGMASHPGTPFDPDMLEPRHWLADIIYFPRETELVTAARQRGLRAVGGEAMVIGQAAEAFRLFTGLTPDKARMRRAMQARDAMAAARSPENETQQTTSEE